MHLNYPSLLRLQGLLYNNRVLIIKKKLIGIQDLLREDCPAFVVYLMSSASAEKFGAANWEIFFNQVVDRVSTTYISVSETPDLGPFPLKHRPNS